MGVFMGTIHIFRMYRAGISATLLSNYSDKLWFLERSAKQSGNWNTHRPTPPYPQRVLGAPSHTRSKVLPDLACGTQGDLSPSVSLRTSSTCPVGHRSFRTEAGPVRFPQGTLMRTWFRRVIRHYILRNALINITILFRGCTQEMSPMQNAFPLLGILCWY
jgi:hypothetical protein